VDIQRWQRIGAIFDQAIDAPPHARACLLEGLCDGDPELRREVEALLGADAAATAFERGVDAARNSAALEWAETREGESGTAGERIGPWRVLRELGRGGMGVVLLAERADGQFQQRAAIKLIKRGMDSDAVQARFLRERQILARLQHPHIAHLLDGGIGADGRPYFAMEYVEGNPLLRYCSETGMKLEGRIKLFVDICAAVHFAHAQLVVHRDIKPSNILVGADGAAKLLDFGIAKLLDDSGPGAAATVDASQRPLTAAYAAPEQLRGEPVTTATDIYALGCVLCELLSGRRPFALGDSPTLEEVARAQATTNPLAPSRLADGACPVPARRLRGDLDTIVLKALQREPARRYATVAAFAEDLQRYLSGQPILARRDHAGYRLGKFVGRHRLGVAAAVAGLMVLIGALVFALWQAAEKAREAQASQEVSRFLVELFAAADPTHANGATISAKDLLDQGAERLRGELGTEPVLRARLLHTVATTYVALGLYARALPLEERALQLRRAHLDPRDPEIADSLDELGQIHTLSAEYAKADPLLRDALALRLSVLDKDDPAQIDSLGNLGRLLRDRGDFAAADGLFREALAASERHYGAGATPTARRLDDLAGNLDNLGKRADAVAIFRRALAIREKNLGPDDAEVATSLQNLGVHLDDTGNFAEAVTLLERALAIRRRIFGPDHPLVGFAELALAGVYESLGRIADCERSATDALAIFRHTLPADHPKISESLNMLGIVHLLRRDFSGAAPLLREVVARYATALGADHPDTLSATNNLAYVLLRDGQMAEAERLQRAILARVRGDNGQSLVAFDNQNLAGTLEAEGKFDEALTFAHRALAFRQKSEGAVSGNVAVALRLVAVAEEMRGDAPAAERDFRDALRMSEQLPASQATALYPWQIALADFLAGARRCEEATPLLESALGELARIPNRADPQWQPQAQLLLGHCERATPRRDASRLMSAARRTLRTMPAIELDLYPTALKLFSRK
jgi:serine/threonine-protein kinase